jgi:hypothetical protein
LQAKKALFKEQKNELVDSDTKNLIFIKLINPAPEISWIIYDAD